MQKLFKCIYNVICRAAYKLVVLVVLAPENLEESATL